MNYKMADLTSLEKESIYIPFQGIQAERQIRVSERKAYSAYSAKMYRQHGIWIQPFTDLVLDNNDKSVYFHVSNYIPHFINKSYNVEVISGHYLIDYLKGIDEGTYVMISVKDEGSQQISESVVEQLRELGITQINKTHLRYSYLWIACNKDGSFEVLHEDCSIDELHWEGMIGETKTIVKSGGALSSNFSSIQLNDEEWSCNQRGFNVVTYSPSVGVQSINFDTFATLYAQGSLFKANPPKSKDTLTMFTSVCNAGGQIEGVNYTNCKEAFEQSYTIRGHRVFQVDLELTSDDELVARQNWDSYLYRFLGQPLPEGTQEGQPLSLQQFTSLKILNHYTPLTIVDLLQFLIDHPDAYLVTASKYSRSEMVDKQFKKLVEAAQPFGYRVLLRVIPQLYSEEMYDVIENIFPFPRYVYNLYQTKASDDDVIHFVKEEKVRFVTMYPERYSADFGAELKKNGCSVFIHSINDTSIVREYIHLNVDGFYTDNLSAGEIEKELFGYQIELSTRRQVLSEFIKVQFKLPEEEVRDALGLLDLKELTIIAERLFESKTTEDVCSLLQQNRSIY